MSWSKYDIIFEGKGCKVQQLSCRCTGWDFSRQLEALFPDKKYQSRIYFPIKVQAQGLRLLVALDDKFSSEEIFNSLKICWGSDANCVLPSREICKISEV